MPLQALEVGQHASSRRREAQAPTHAIEQGVAHGGFQLLQHLGGCRLGQAQLGSGGAQRAAIANGQQQGHLAHAQAVQQLWGGGSAH